MNPVSPEESGRFDAQGRLRWSQNGGGRTPGGAARRYEYDPAGRLVAAHYPGQFSVRYRYDPAGRLLEAASSGCTTRYSYQDDCPWPARLEQTVRPPAGAALPDAPSWAEFTYTNDGRITGARVDGFPDWIRYRYDEQGRLTALGCDDAPELVRLEYPSEGQSARLRYSNGVTQTIEMDRLSQVKRIHASAPSGETLLDLKYRSGEAGRITALNDQRYQYDSHGRLVAYGPLVGELSRCEYDPAGNRLRQSLSGGRTVEYSYDRLGRLSQAGGTRCGYDGEGRLVARIDGRGRWSYGYDPLGRMTRLSRDGRTVAACTYDHAGRRVSCTRQTSNGAETTRYLRDAWGNLLAEVTSSGERRLYLGPAGRPLICLVAREGAAAPYFLHSDHLGSVRLVTGADGSVLERCDYDPFGNPIAGSEPATWRIFAGYHYDPALGFYDAGVRLYDPQVGRFTTPDPYTCAADDPRLLWLPPGQGQAVLRRWMEQPGRRNRYTYALNSPLTYIDPDGRSAGLYALYIFLGVVWALPYTLVGFLFFEVFLNWITFAWLWDMGDHGWSGESSDRLGAWAWWVSGGLSGKMVIGGGGFTLGNFVIANAGFMNGLDKTVQSFGIPSHHTELSAVPFDPSKLLTEYDAVIEHELRHTNQYGWWGPFWAPFILILFFLFYNLILTGVSVFTKNDLNVKWSGILDTFFGSVGRGILTGVGLLFTPGVYFWDLIFRGGYADSYFEHEAAQQSGVAFGQSVHATPSKDEVSPNGDVIVTVISDVGKTVSLAIKTNGSGAPAAGNPADITPPQVTNLRVFRYTAGPNPGTDVLTGGDGTDTMDVKIEVK